MPQRLLTACLLLLLGAAAHAKSIVKDIRMSAEGENTRIVFDLSEATTQQVFTLHSPERVVIDLDNARLDFDAWPASAGVVKQFRSAERGNGVLRIVLEVSQLVESRSFNLPAADGVGQRLVIDIAAPGKLEGKLEGKFAVQPMPPPAASPAVKVLPKETEGRTLVIAIDAGHGGTDPGASGRRGTREKDVTLAIARKLKDLIDREPGMRAVMTREGDYFVPLRERIVRARKAQADLFISIHADSVRDRGIAGSSVYVLSAGRAVNEAARMLADRENAADLMGGMALEHKDDVVASVLLDISQGASMSASIAAADRVLKQLHRVSPAHDEDVRHASLKVLTSPDMPSMLVETAFISNPREEAKLKDPRHQQRLADAMLMGVRSYFHDNPPPGTRLAQRARERSDSLHPGAIVAGGLSQ